LGGATALAAHSHIWAAAHLAWEKPIGLETYTVRDLFAKDPTGTLKQVAAVGYKEVEFNPGIKPSLMNSYLRDAGLSAPSTYVDHPKTIDDWKKTVDLSKNYGVHYVVVGDNPRLDADAWKRRAELYNQCGKLAQNAGMQFCYHAHYNEYARVDNTSGYDIMLARCDSKLLNMEMDIFWAVYAGVDPLHYWGALPGPVPTAARQGFVQKRGSESARRSSRKQAKSIRARWAGENRLGQDLRPRGRGRHPTHFRRAGHLQYAPA